MSPPSKSLTNSIASDSLSDSLAGLGDAAIDAAVESGALDGIPILGTLNGMYKAQRDVRQKLYYNKIVRFLIEMQKTSAESRSKFIERINEAGELEHFGETILLILEKIDDTRKPTFVGRIMAAHIEGHIDYSTSMRLVSIINRCYSEDLNYLKSFKAGTQGQDFDIANSLFSAGLLSNTGISGGSYSPGTLSGGLRYDINTYGKLLLKHALI